MPAKSAWVTDAEFMMGVAWDAFERGHDDRQHQLQSLLFFALALERLLKGVLHEVNPLYVYEKLEFEHSLKTHYAGRVVEPKNLGGKDTTSKTCSLTSAAQRARHLSPSVAASLPRITRVANVRNELCHGSLATINDAQLSSVWGDAFEVSYAVAAELGVQPKDPESAEVGEGSERAREAGTQRPHEGEAKCAGREGRARVQVYRAAEGREAHGPRR